MNLTRKDITTEKQYRKLTEILSYSSLKMFSKDRGRFYKKFILGEFIKEEDSDDMIRGSVVESLLWDEEDVFDEKFYISSCEAPKENTNMATFVNLLYDKSIECCRDGVVTRDFGEMMLECYNEVGIKKPGYEKWVESFLGSGGEKWYNEKRATINKTVVSLQLITNCEAVKEALKGGNLGWLVNMESSEGIDVYHQFPIIYHYLGMDLRSMVDKLIVDHKKKIIYIYDLKISWQLENFKLNYLKNGYYIQAGLYKVAVSIWAEEMGYLDYEIKDMQFIVGDSINKSQPLLWQLSGEDSKKALEGFTYKGEHYKGVNQLIEEINWSLSSNIWNIEKTHYENNNIAKLELNYE